MSGMTELELIAQIDQRARRPLYIIHSVTVFLLFKFAPSLSFPHHAKESVTGKGTLQIAYQHFLKILSVLCIIIQPGEIFYNYLSQISPPRVGENTRGGKTGMTELDIYKLNQNVTPRVSAGWWKRCGISFLNFQFQHSYTEGDAGSMSGMTELELIAQIDQRARRPLYIILSVTLSLCGFTWPHPCPSPIANAQQGRELLNLLIGILKNYTLHLLEFDNKKVPPCFVLFRNGAVSAGWREGIQGGARYR